MSYVTENFDQLKEIGKCIAMQFSTNCEVVLHDLTRPYDQSIVAIWNGHVTGRKLGEGLTVAEVEILRSATMPEDRYNYINYTKDGRALRSSSKYFLDEKGKLVGCLCINFDITALVMAQNVLQTVTISEQSVGTEEVFTDRVDELLEVLMIEGVKSTGKTLESLDKEDKVAVVRYLDSKGAFLIKKSAERVAEFLGISRFTVYNYLNESHEES